jgi:MFS family permease
MGRKWQYYHTVWAIMVFGWVANYMVRSGLSPVLIPIREEFGLTYAEAGLIGSALFYAYVGILFPAGYIGDQVGRKIVLVMCTFWWAVASVLTGLANSFPTLFLSRFLTGIGQGSYFSNDRPIISAYTPREKVGLGQGVSFIGLGTGMCLGYILSGFISVLLGWRYVFYLFSIPSFVAAFLILKIIREPKDRSSNMHVNHETKASLSIIFKQRDLWMLYIGGIPAIYAVWMAGTWVPAMFEELGVESLAISSLFASLLGISAVPGLIITGYLSDKLGKRKLGRKGLIAAEFFLMGFFMFLMGLAVRQHWSALTGAFIIFCFGFFVWGLWAPFYALIADIVPKEVQGSCYGLTNSINFIGSLIAPPLTGWIKDVTSSFEWGCYLTVIVILIGSIFILCVNPPFRLKPEIPIHREGERGAVTRR